VNRPPLYFAVERLYRTVGRYRNLFTLPVTVFTEVHNNATSAPFFGGCAITQLLHVAWHGFLPKSKTLVELVLLPLSESENLISVNSWLVNLKTNDATHPHVTRKNQLVADAHGRDAWVHTMQAGLDMNMPGNDHFFDADKLGTTSTDMAALDDMVSDA
jgi:hypothetical protein